jgi:hypothetical protein
MTSDPGAAAYLTRGAHAIGPERSVSGQWPVIRLMIRDRRVARAGDGDPEPPQAADADPKIKFF